MQVPAGELDTVCANNDIQNCAYAKEQFDAATLKILQEKLASAELGLAQVNPVVLLSWNINSFLLHGDSEPVSTQKEMENAGGMVLQLDKIDFDHNYFDIAEWKNTGSNLKAGYETTIHRWQDANEPPYIQVVRYDREFQVARLKVRSYADNPIFVVAVNCVIDVTSLHEARACTFATDVNNNVLPLLRLSNNETKEIEFPYDVRANQYFKDRPSAYKNVATTNPFRTYFVASPFTEDISERASPTISAMRNILANSRYHRIASIDIFADGYKNFYIYQKIQGISFFVGDYFATDFTTKAVNFLSSLATPWAGSALPIGGPYVENMLGYLKTSVLPKEARVIDRTDDANALSPEEKQSIDARKRRIADYIKNLPAKERQFLCLRTSMLMNLIQRWCLISRSHRAVAVIARRSRLWVLRMHFQKLRWTHYFCIK